MLSNALTVAFAALSLLAPASAGDTTNTAFFSTPTAQPTGLRSLKYMGCFASAKPMIDHGPYDFQSSGNCQGICYTLQNAIMALGNGTDCWCGDLLPAKDSKVDDKLCSTPCSGYRDEKCGSAQQWTVYNTGFSLNEPQYYVPQDKPSSSASPSASPTGKSNKSGTDDGKGGSNTVGIVVGVVVGLVVLSGLAGAGFIYLRRKQQREMEEFKRQTDTQSFAKVEDQRPNMWAPDNRLDNDGRRISNGSIADNEDFSRKILQVRNPDGF